MSTEPLDCLEPQEPDEYPVPDDDYIFTRYCEYVISPGDATGPPEYCPEEVSPGCAFCEHHGESEIDF